MIHKLRGRRLDSNRMAGPLSDVFGNVDLSVVDQGGVEPPLYERLHNAVNASRLDETRQILEENNSNLEEVKCLINFSYKKGRRILFTATERNDSDMIKLLKSFGADVMMPDSKGWLPLHLAAKKGYTECCNELLSDQKAEAQLNAANEAGMLPHMMSAELGHYSCCELLVNTTNINHKNKEGNTALIITVEKAHEKIAELLLGKGTNVNHRNNQGYTAVHKAVQLKSSACIEVLQRKNANMRMKTNNEEGVLHLAVKKESEICVRYLLTNSSVMSMINDPDLQGKTPLYNALKVHSYRLAHMLLNYGASPKTCVNKVMPIHLAADRGYHQVCHEILYRDASCLHEKNHEGLSPLLIAAKRKLTKVCKVLINFGANLREVDEKSRTALHLALLDGGCKDTVEVLLRGSISMVDSSGFTPLHTAVKGSSHSCCKLLLKDWKDATSCLWKMDQENHYPLDIAYEINHEKKFKLLLEKMAENRSHEDQGLRKRIHEYVHNALEKDMEKRFYVIEAVVHSWVEVAFEPLCGDERQCTLFQKLIEDQPKLAAVALDQSLAHNDDSFQVFENFHFTDDDERNSSTYDPESLSGWRLIGQQIRLGQGSLWLKKHPVTLMIQKERNELLQHKLTEEWIRDRWQHHVKMTHRLLILFHLMAFVFLFGFISTAWNEHHIYLKYNTTLEEFCDPPPVFEGDDPKPLPTTTHIVFLWLYVSTYISQVIIYTLYVIMVYKWCRLDLCIKVIELSLMLCVLLPLSRCQLQTGVRKDWAWQCGVTAVLLSWMHFLSFANKSQRNPLFPIAKDFVKILCMWLYYVLMVVMVFAFIFHLLLQEQEVFGTMESSFVKTFTWMLLDLSYNDTFIGPDKVPYTFLSNALFLVFIVSVGCFIVSLVNQQFKGNEHQTSFTFQRAAHFATMVMEFEVWFLWFRRYSCKRKPQGNQMTGLCKKLSRNEHLRSLTEFFRKLFIVTDDDNKLHDKYTEQLENMLQKQGSEIERLKRMNAKIDSIENTINSLTGDITHSISHVVREQLDLALKKQSTESHVKMV